MREILLLVFLVLPLANAQQWAIAYGGGSVDEARSIQQTSDGGYIVAGWTDSFGVGGKDIWILKLDEEGNIEWQKTYGGSGNESAYSIQQTSDDGYIVAGYTESFGAGECDFWVLKLNENGEIPNCPHGSDTYAEVNETQVTPNETSATIVETTVKPQDTDVEPIDTDCTKTTICYFTYLKTTPYPLTMVVGEEKSFDLVLDWAPNGLKSYAIVLSMEENVSITDVTLPDWCFRYVEEKDYGWYVQCLDTNNEISEEATDIVLATINVIGAQAGTSDLFIQTVGSTPEGWMLGIMDDNAQPMFYENVTVDDAVVVCEIVPFPGCVNPPTDPDGDGLYEDTNGNGVKDVNDLFVLFNYMDWVESNGYTQYFDFNGNQDMDINDLFVLFNEIPT